ncbi:pyruvate, phosphate dikinase [Candidatus Gracilibacteria bacterium]|nr:pyruvate, phosphate dikinase [Candidatus Gracilibacteria bacterium]
MISSSSVAKASRPDISSDKLIYAFDEADKSMKDLLGGKGANLCEMTKIGVPVPYGFTITTEVCHDFLELEDYPEGFAAQLEEKLTQLETRTGKKLGDSESPLLVSVRSGAAVSMPGMMDTILNLGLNDKTVEALATKTGNARFAYDSYRRFVQMYSDVVLAVKRELLEEELEKMKEEKKVKLDTDLSADDWKKLIVIFKEIVKKESGHDFPESPLQQLKFAVEAVFKSWNNERAIAYRRMNKIADLRGTAVTIQAMVFGNMGEDSGTGVAFTRNPSTGEKEFYGEFLMNAQGEDVVAGIRTPMDICELEKINKSAFDELIAVKDNLEKHYKNMQDIEFTIEQGKLFLLQTRNGKRTAHAAIRTAVEMVNEGLLTKEEALLQIDANSLNQLLHPYIKKSVERQVIAKGLPASPGAASGKIVFCSETAVDMAEQGEKVILVRKETSPEDISGMHAAQGVLTARGGMTSHAAVVARGMGKCCVAGCTDIMVNASAKKLLIGEMVINEGDIVTLDGSTGEVMMGELEMQDPELSEDFKTVMEWADEVRTLQIRTNADNPHDCEVALGFGAEGIGLCRTEHMFFEEDRIDLVRKMILAKNSEERSKPLEKLLAIQRGDFEGIFKVMEGKALTIRLLDPPLHEFLPHENAQIEKLALSMDISRDELCGMISKLDEVNPMLGHRGCRLGITFPEIYEMQVKAIIEAANAVAFDGIVEIEIPLVGMASELKYLRKIVEKVIEEYDVKFEYKIGTMIEVPRACITADEIAKYADFFSFGTNDLTQMCFGFSRDDIGKFLPDYLDKGVLELDPMGSIDQKGVGRLMEFCVELGRKTKPDLEIGICGEQGGDPESVEFCHKLGLDYVSCSPYRVPIARLAAAQAALRK